MLTQIYIATWQTPCHKDAISLIHVVGGAFNSLRPRRNGRYDADDIFKCIFLKENVWILTKISLKFVPKGPINNISALVHIMAWHPSGDKPLSKPMMVSLLTHICVTRPQWLNSLWPTDAIWRPILGSTLTQVMNGLFPDGIKPLTELILTCHP